MNTQYLQYVREQLMVATADLSGRLKGSFWPGWRTRNSTRKTIPEKTAYLGRGNRKLDNVK